MCALQGHVCTPTKDVSEQDLQRGPRGPRVHPSVQEYIYQKKPPPPFRPSGYTSCLSELTVKSLDSRQVEDRSDGADV